MTAFRKLKKRKLHPKEKKEVEAFKKALSYLTKDHSKQVCPDFMPGCPACQYWILVGMLRDHIATLTWL